MHVEMTRLVTAALQDPKTGVNALLLYIPRKRMNGTSDAKPSPVLIYNDVDAPDGMSDDHWMREINPPTKPSLVVIADSDPRTTDTAAKFKQGHAASLMLAVAYFAEDTLRDRAVRDGNYVLRASAKSLMALSGTSVANRTVNDFLLVQIEEMVTQRVAGAVSDNLMGILFARVTVLDKSP